MGRLVVLEACPVCNYNVEGVLHVGWSTRSRLFLLYRYDLAICHTCHNIISVLVPVPEHDRPLIDQAARQDLETLEKRAEAGDFMARRLLPLHRLALEPDETLDEVEVGLCTACGSTELESYPTVGGDEGEHFEDGTAWLDCPRCDEGRLWVRSVGTWDEIDDGL